MINVHNTIYCGDENDANVILKSTDWLILHCCKDPFHKQLAGYRGNLSPANPNYAFVISDNRMALNLVDMEIYNPNYLEFNYQMFYEAFKFLDNNPYQKKILIHCNKGESRGPSITLLYLKHMGYFRGLSFEKSKSEFIKLYPKFNPKLNIITNIEKLWERF